MIRVDGLAKSFHVSSRDEVRAVNGVTFEVDEGQFFTLLGPSGCGKTTTLRCIAGLERPDDGVIYLGATAVFSRNPDVFIPPYRRPIGMVFQSYAIWPHMNVFENVAFPLRVGSRKFSKQEVTSKVEAALALVHLDGLETRMATRLSGGQQQRLALARALIREPEVLLLDEPLSNLDAKLREQMRAEIRDLQRRLGMTTIYVTHDQAEALSMSDVIAVMQDGLIVQQGNPEEIYNAPRARFVAEFIGSPNVLGGRVGRHGPRDGQVEFDSIIGTVSAVAASEMNGGDAGVLVIRPENLVIQRERGDEDNLFEGVVAHVMFLGDVVDCRIDVGGHVLHTRLHPGLRLQVGDTVWVGLPRESCLILPADASHHIAGLEPSQASEAGDSGTDRSQTPVVGGRETLPR
jgi:iron(III) transport system ATP-binding protein